MPSEHERHSRPNGCCEGIYSQPSRSQQLAAVVAEQQHPGVVPQGKRPPGKKDPSLCKAAHWKGPHRPEVVKREVIPGRVPACGWQVSWTGDTSWWSCQHEERCGGCGKVLRHILGDDCPDWHPMTGAERTAADDEIRRHQEHREGRKRVIAGPQGYRKKRSA
jgi:hypothetical protein